METLLHESQIAWVRPHRQDYQARVRRWNWKASFGKSH